MATITKADIAPVRTLHGGPPSVQEVDEGASQTFVKGEMVNMVSGLLTELSSDTGSTIYGVAADDARNGTAGQYKCGVYMADPNTLFEANMLTTAAADYVLTQADLGTPMAIQRVTADSRVYLNAATKAGANVRVFVHAVAKNSLVGDTNARVLFSFMPNWIQQLGTS